MTTLVTRAIADLNQPQPAKSGDIADFFFDDFSGAEIDPAKWNVPPLRPKELPVFEAKDSKLLVHYNTFNPNGTRELPNFTPHMGTAARFGPGFVGGDRKLVVEARLRVPNAPPGLNAAFFVYESEKDSPDTQDEIDIELLTTVLDKVWVNTFNGLASGVLSNWVTPGHGYDMREWNTYAFHWKAGKPVQWLVNGHGIRPLLTFNPPDEAMTVNFGYWKPEKSWTEAYHPFLDDKGAKTPAENTRYTMEVDWVRVRLFAAKQLM